jgi:hypothetical protein
MTQPQGALLVGSINIPDAESAIRTASELLGAHLKRIPDGEVGDRFHWIGFQADRIGATPGIERVGDEPILQKGLDFRAVRIADGVDAETLELAPLGYAESALESWQVFARLQDAGEVGPDVRFQVSLPTPAAVVAAFVPADQRERFEPVYRRALFAELDRILAGIPHEKLAIQWDTAVEFGLIEGASGYDSHLGGAYVSWFDDVWGGVIERALEQVARVPHDVEVGFHLCYGDANEEHFVEPSDTTNLVRFAQALVDNASRRIDWVHLPVPISRVDDEYFAPLEKLVLPAETELYLGLVHREDLVDGAAARIATAQRHVERFGVATECGCGRAPVDETAALIAAHADVAAPWA